MKIGRNAPCPCGSGRKYKHCCLGKQTLIETLEIEAGEHAAPNEAARANEALRAAIGDREFENMEEFQAFAEAFMASRNAQPMDDFEGLSPSQMQALLNHPFESPGVIDFGADTPAAADAPVIRMIGLLAEALGEKGLKATAKGNLPRAAVREVMRGFLGEAGYERRTEFGALNSEDDAPELFKCRYVASRIGLLRKYKSRWQATAKLRQAHATDELASLYPSVFEAYVREYNWAYEDLYEEFAIMQHGFAFTLHLLLRFGDEPRPASFYAGKFLNAFPMLLDEAPADPYRPPREYVADAYRVRVLERSLAFLGLAQVEDRADLDVLRDVLVEGTELLREFVRIRVLDSRSPPAPDRRFN